MSIPTISMSADILCAHFMTGNAALDCDAYTATRTFYPISPYEIKIYLRIK